MLYLYHSNALDQLRDVLVEMIRRAPLADPFACDQILVQSPGMAQWLKLELAEQIGICANVDFPLPASFLWRIFSEALEDVPERSAYSKDTMTWSLMRLLPKHIHDPEFELLQHFLAVDDDPLRLYHLCAKVADLFDQYLVYRPDWIADWEAGGHTAVVEDHTWQPILWREIVNDTLSRGLPHWHRANMYETFVNALNAKSHLSQLPDRIFVFGISALPKNYLEALAAVAKKTDVHLMVANPCRYYWGDIIDPKYLAKLNRKWFKEGRDPELLHYDEGHPLLASMGKLGRDYLYLLQEMGIDEVGLFSDSRYDSLLHAVQSDILELKNQTRDEKRDSTFTWGHQADRSIELHKAYSPIREVEILHDQLLAMFEEDSSLKPRDIIVMVPDVAAYAPYIDAVFGNAHGETYLPYSISDRSADQEIPLINSFLHLITLDRKRFTTTEILDLLELPATLRAFGLSKVEFDQIRAWVSQAGIQWGVNAGTRKEICDVAFDQNSWSFGLDRLMSGYAMGDAQALWHNIAPLGEVSGLASATLGEFERFFDALVDLRNTFTGAKMLEDWSACLHALIEAFYTPDERDQEALEMILTSLESLQATLSEAHYPDAIDARILQDYLGEQLTSIRSTQRFLSGQINFCTLMPMRAIPFKVVCLLGMNDGEYPRSIPPMGFDLMSKPGNGRKGDRSRRDDDRYLFLEALLSARERLYISYVGRSIQDNSERVPSVLVSELMEYCDQAYSPVADSEPGKLIKEVTIEHPLTAYSRDYYVNPDDRLFSFNPRWARAAQQGHSCGFLDKVLSPAEKTKLELDELVRFYRDPIEAFFSERLQVRFPETSGVPDDEEPFEAAGLSKYQLRKRLMEAALKENDLADLSAFLLRQGGLPVGRAGEREVAQRIKDVVELRDKLYPLMDGEPELIEVRLNIPISVANPTGNAVALEGWLTGVYAEHRLVYNVTKLSGKQLIALWIEHLALCAMGHQKPSVFRALDKQIRFLPLDRHVAMEHLSRLVEGYLVGLTAPMAWSPTLAKPLLEAKDEDKAWVKAEEAFVAATEGDWINYYLLRTYPNWSLFKPAFVEHHQTLFGSVHDYLEES
jgi:exodeoxyribonuclease V gamma subunit